MESRLSEQTRSIERPSRAVLAALTVAVLVLAAKLALFLAFAAKAVRFPYELDYGEGIVWQQMLLMFDGRGYGAIDGLPAIVFHYPPVFHGLVMGTSKAFALDPLAAGRLVSLAATLVAGAFVGLIAYRLARREADRRTATLSATAGGLIALAFLPVSIWAPLMRVDMVAMALSLAGLHCGLAALERPRMVLLAALCFVAAVYTKQTSLAAPAATFLVLLLVRPRTAFTGIAACLILGLAALGALAWATDGGFLRHIFLYNINRFDTSRLIWIPQMAAAHMMFFAAVGVGLFAGLSGRFPAFRAERSLRALRSDLAAPGGDGAFLMLLVYLLAATATLAMVAKSGASINYLIEWMLASAIFAGLGLAALAGRPKARRLALLLPLAVAFQAVLVPAEPGFAAAMTASRTRELEQLSAQIAAASRPVISDDMVILLRSGKEVQWEPAIFAELASTGAWDERPFVERIRRREFAFFVTVGGRGSRLFDSRYTPAVADAIAAAYPVRRKIAGYIVHAPAQPF